MMVGEEPWVPEIIHCLYIYIYIYIYDIILLNISLFLYLYFLNIFPTLPY